MSETDETTIPESADIRCRNCGHPLRGRAEGDCCSECGTPVRVSIGSQALTEAEPRWCRSLWHGAFLIAAGLSLVLVIGLISSAVVGMATSMGAQISSGLWVLNISMLTVFVGVYVFGVWRFTAREPSDAHDDMLLTARNLARYCLIVDVISTPMMLIVQNPLVNAPGGALAGLVATVLSLANLGALVGWLALAIHAQRIVHRAGLPKSATALRVVFTGYAITATLTGAVGFVGMLTGVFVNASVNMTPGAKAVGVAACGGYFFTLGFGIVAASLMFRAGLVIRRHAKAAQIRWDGLISAPTQPA